ncbi:MAG: hypothetical protein ACRDH9_13330 [Actinomycetota bacterium]
MKSDARISWHIGANPDVQIEGQGLFPGFALVRDASIGDSPALVAGRAPVDALCSGEDCLPTEYVISTFPEDSQTESYLIPKGSYSLFLLAFGSPVSVAFTLHGLEGSRNLALTEAAHASSYRMSPEVVIPTEPLYWDGTFREMDGPGLIFTWSAIVSRYLVNDEMAHCYYDEEPDPPIAYVPTCPGGSSVAFSETWVGAPVFRHQMFGFMQTAGGGNGVSYWHLATHPVEKTTAFAVWLTY